MSGSVHTRTRTPTASAVGSSPVATPLLSRTLRQVRCGAPVASYVGMGEVWMVAADEGARTTHDVLAPRSGAAHVNALIPASMGSSVAGSSSNGRVPRGEVSPSTYCVE